jgi:F0F1-type ATP synthase membrane subunit b/b'
MKHIAVGAVTALFVVSLGSTVLAQVPSAGDMQQKLDQEMANAKRSASESSSAARQGAANVKSEAERKMEDTAVQHKVQAEGKMTEEIEKAKQKAQGMGR